MLYAITHVAETMGSGAKTWNFLLLQASLEISELQKDTVISKTQRLFKPRMASKTMSPPFSDARTVKCSFIR